MKRYQIYRTECGRRYFYHHYNGLRGISCGKKGAPLFDERMAQTIVRQLAVVDARGWAIYVPQ